MSTLAAKETSPFSIPAKESILVKKGNQIHLFLIYLGASYMILFAAVNYFFDDKVNAAIVNVCTLPFIFIAFILFRKGYSVASKLLNLSMIISAIILIFLFTRSSQGVNNGDSILAFFIPVFIGTLIVFQGKERTLGYVFAIFILVLMIILIVSDFHLGEAPAFTKEQFRRELTLNLIGAAVATICEVIYFSVVSNSIDEELIKANKELDSFVYSVSHDLRSPLLSVKGLMTLMKQTDMKDAQFGKYIDVAEKTLIHLDDTIREILAYSKNSRLGLKLEIFDVKDMVEAIFGDVKFSTSDDLHFNCDIQGSSMLNSDRSRLNTVLRNLIGNAVKYRKPDATDSFVNFTMKREGKNILMEVEDNGEGISAENLNKVFEMFYRGTNTGQGTGLGLYICKEVLEKLGGKIDIQSTLSVGTKVKITLPEQ